MTRPGPARPRFVGAVATLLSINLIALLMGAPAMGRSVTAVDDHAAPAVTELTDAEIVASTAWAEPSGVPEELSDLTARSVLVIDATTGQPLIAMAPRVARPVASTIKLLTVLTALDHLDTAGEITVGAEVGLGGAGVGLVEGDTWSVSDLVAATIVRSGNDAAMGLALAAASTVADFVELMRARAASLALQTARIQTPTGLDDMNLMSAADLATVARAALASEAIRDVAGLTEVDLPSGPDQINRNTLVGSDPRVTGLKTGFTTLAGYCVVVSRRFEDTQLVAVLLGAEDDAIRFEEATALLDAAEAGWERRSIDELRVRYPGESLRVMGAPGSIWVPRERGQVVEPSAHLLAAGGSTSWTVRLAGQRELVSRTLPGATHAHESVGQRLAGRAYEGMRRAHVADLWPAVGAPTTQ